jgi:hypothetical protein
MAASTMSQMMVSMNLGGLQALRVQSSSLSKLGDARLATTPRLMTSIAGRVRCQAGDGKGPSPLADVKNYVDQSTKQEITKDDILRNQESNESEKRSVFGAKPNSGSLYPRPELERRPETGSKSFWSVFAFDGAAPETINGRLVSSVFLSGRNFAKWEKNWRFVFGSFSVAKFFKQFSKNNLIARFYRKIQQVAKNVEGFYQIFLTFILACCQIWLKHLMDDRHFS